MTHYDMKFETQDVSKRHKTTRKN
jgi:hypothetical protein